MSDNDQLTFVAYGEPREATSRWYKDILFRLWQYGLSFSPPWRKNVTWEQELADQPASFLEETNLPNPEARVALSQWAEDAAAAGHGTLYAYDKHLRLRLTLQPQIQEIPDRPGILATPGILEINYDRVFLNPEYNQAGELLPSYLQTWIAHLHWAEICCILLRPFYALSYQHGDIIYEQPHIPEAGGEASSRDPLLKALAQVRQTRPIVVPPLERTRLQYFAPQLLSAEEEQALLRLPFQLTEYLPTGGLLVIPRAEPFHYGFGLGHTFWNQMREVAEQEGNDEEASRLMERGNALFDIYRRMQGS